MTDSIKSEVSHLGQQEAVFPSDHENYSDYCDETKFSAYTEDEINEARQEERLILKGIKLYLRIGYKTAAHVYEFREKKLYRRLGYKSFHEWIRFSGLPRATIYRYLQAYIALTVDRKIPLDEYKQIDVGKVHALRPLLKAGATTSEVLDAIQDSRELCPADLRVVVYEKARRIKNGTKKENITGETVNEKEKKVDPLLLMDSGYYTLTPLDISTVTPEKTAEKMGFEEVGFTQNTLFYNRPNNTFIIHIKNKMYRF